MRRRRLTNRQVTKSGNGSGERGTGGKQIRNDNRVGERDGGWGISMEPNK